MVDIRHLEQDIRVRDDTPKYADKLAELGVNSVTVTINAVDPDIAVDIYSFIKYEGKVYKGYEAVKILIKNQLDGVEKAAAK